MEERLGVIAGSGRFPFLVCEEAQKQGYFCVVAGIRDEADPELEGCGNDFAWFGLYDVSRVISFFKQHDVRKAVFAGKIDPRVVYKLDRTGSSLLKMLTKIKDINPPALIQLAIDTFRKQGVDIIEPTAFITSAFCEAGVLTQTKPSPQLMEDMDFGWEIARRIADFDIGQSVIVKSKTIVAVEGVEGTNEAVVRGGELAGEGVVLVKVVRSRQDSRIDLPAVGLETIKSLVKVKGKALCFEAKKMPFFQKDEAFRLADAYKICIVAKTSS